MKDKRVGEDLWSEWTGEDCLIAGSNAIFFTQEHVDLDIELIRRALASALQRTGVANGLGDGFKLIESSQVEYGHAGALVGELDLIACDASGETRYGDTVEEVLEVTWVAL